MRQEGGLTHTSFAQRHAQPARANRRHFNPGPIMGSGCRTPLSACIDSHAITGYSRRAALPARAVGWELTMRTLFVRLCVAILAILLLSSGSPTGTQAAADQAHQMPARPVNSFNVEGLT